jgi:outer membrane protein assembly factor BamB
MIAPARRAGLRRVRRRLPWLAMPRLFPRRPLWRGLLAAVMVVVALAVAAVVVIVANKPHNVSHPGLEFTNPTTTEAAPPKHVKRKQVDNFQWPVYGYRQSRTRDFDGPADLKPPLHVGWKYNDGALLEFPPVIYHEQMFVLDDDASAKAVNIKNGKVVWERKLGELAAASPVVAGHQGEVLMPTLSNHGHSPGGGSFYALSMKTGKVIWKRPIGAGSETSPIVSGRTVYYGDGAGNLYARDVINGHLDWAYHAAGAIKGGPALVDGVLYFGDYAGRAYAVRASNGHQVWAVSTDGAHFGFGSGQFYTTPAVAFGRVYMGNTDGFVYSFGARNGKLAWRTHTGAYVYASAAVADPKGVGPTVYVGSYDENFYAFDARSGAIRWKHAAGGRISGSATVVGNVVYYSNLAAKTTTGLNVATGKPVFSFHDGAFTPVIADYHAIYLVGYGEIYQLLPSTAKPKHAAAPAHAGAHHGKTKPKAKTHPKAKPKPKHGAKAAAKPTHRTSSSSHHQHRKASSGSRRHASHRSQRRSSSGHTSRRKRSHGHPSHRAAQRHAKHRHS